MPEDYPDRKGLGRMGEAMAGNGAGNGNEIPSTDPVTTGSIVGNARTPGMSAVRANRVGQRKPFDGKQGRQQLAL